MTPAASTLSSLSDTPLVERIPLTVEQVKAATPVLVDCGGGRSFHYGKANLREISIHARSEARRTSGEMGANTETRALATRELESAKAASSDPSSRPDQQANVPPVVTVARGHNFSEGQA